MAAGGIMPGSYPGGFLPGDLRGLKKEWDAIQEKKKPKDTDYEPEYPKNEAGRKVDGNFYGHIKSGSVKASKKIKGVCK